MYATPDPDVSSTYDWLVVCGQEGLVRWNEIKKFLVQIARCDLILACDELDARFVQMVIFGSLIYRDQATPL
jgi:hypothetical protein